MSPRAALAEALLVTLAIPATWPLALATFLLRGGLLLVVLPIVVLPSPVSLGNVLGPALTTVVLSGVPVELAVATALIALALVAWLVIGGLVAASLEAESAWLVAGQDDGAGPPVDEGDRPASRRLVTRAFGARCIAHLPTAVAVLWGLARLVEVTYRELTSPSDAVNHIAWRVLRGAPEVIVAVALVWALGKLIGGLAVRRIVLGGSTVPSALRASAVTTARRPVLVLIGFLVPAAGLVVILLPSAAAAATAWGVVRAAMGSSATMLGSTLAVMIFVALWLVGLVLIGVTCAWRAAVWSVIEHDASRRVQGMTFESTIG